jgi:steroid 5-alpha reductase family enzyme
MKRDKKSISIGLVITIALGILMAWAGGQNSVQAMNIAVFSLCCYFAFALNWLVFIPSNMAQTEHYYDLTGSITYISMILLAVVLSPGLDPRGKIVALMVLVWAVRLGSFLFVRIKQDGRDDRFDEIKVNPVRFFFAWTVQALWTIMTAACALVILTADKQAPLEAIGRIGILLWIVGFLIEVIADAQKRAFKKDSRHKGRFIQTGLWSWSQHPNYFGEITLWTGVALMALPIMQGWQHLALISPLFVVLLLTRLSGIPMLRHKAEARWGDDVDYKKYRANTSTLFPMPPKKQ